MMLALDVQHQLVFNWNCYKWIWISLDNLLNSISVTFTFLVAVQRQTEEEQKRNQNEDGNKRASEQNETSKIWHAQVCEIIKPSVILYINVDLQPAVINIYIRLYVHHVLVQHKEENRELEQEHEEQGEQMGRWKTCIHGCFVPCQYYMKT